VVFKVGGELLISLSRTISDKPENYKLKIKILDNNQMPGRQGPICTFVMKYLHKPRLSINRLTAVYATKTFTVP